jgi:transposase
MRFVPQKTADQQAELMLVGVRERLIRNRTRLSNSIRGYAAGFGLVTAKGMSHLGALLDRIQTAAEIPILARELFATLANEMDELAVQIEQLDRRLLTWHRANESSRRLAKIPGVGPIGAVLLTMKTPSPKSFRSGRQFAAWIGLTPKDHSTAGKVRLGVITRAGDEALRSVFGACPIRKSRHQQNSPEALGRAITQPQTGEARRGRARQQNCPDCMEAAGHWQNL